MIRCILDTQVSLTNFCFACIYSLGFVMLFFLMDVTAEFGTTPNIKQIAIERCYRYVTLVNPNPKYTCEAVWQEFEKAVFRRSPCNVQVKDYKKMFQAIPQILPCDKLLFWSKTRGFLERYAAITEPFWTLEDTLVGFVFNDLIWCRQLAEDRGFDYQSCPKWSACLNHPVYSLWKQASQNFAVAACGNITVLLNGSIHHAFNKKSMFGSVELDNLNPRMVTHVHIKVVYNLEGPFMESCTQGSIMGLIEVLKQRGFHWTCTDSDFNV